MGVKINVKPEGLLEMCADILALPIMSCLSCIPGESTRRTHFWNNRMLSESEMNNLDRSIMVKVKGIEGELSSYHAPILGGWRNYVVLQLQSEQIPWHVGWVSGNIARISRIVLKGSVRMPFGAGDVSFFGIHAQTGAQRKIQECGRGRLGDKGPYRKVTLC